VCSDKGSSLDPEWLDVHAAGAIAAELGLHADEAVLAPASAPGVLDDEVGLRVLAGALSGRLELDDLLVVAAVSAVVSLDVPVGLSAASWRASVSASSGLAGGHNHGGRVIWLVWSHWIGWGWISRLSWIGWGWVGWSIIPGGGWHISDNNHTVINSSEWARAGIKKTAAVVVEVLVLSLDSEGHWSVLELVNDISGSSGELTPVGSLGDWLMVAGSASGGSREGSRHIWVVRGSDATVGVLVSPVEDLKTALAGTVSVVGRAINDLLLRDVDWWVAGGNGDHSLKSSVSREGIARSASSLVLDWSHIAGSDPIVSGSGASELSGLKSSASVVSLLL